MAKNIDLLLLKNIENLGIVGDIAKVRMGYARNYLLPHGLAEHPTPSKIEALKEQRAAAQAELGRLRSAREELIERMEDVKVTLVRSCNDKGILYGSVTQRDISDCLKEAGYNIGVRSIRIQHALRHIGEYPVPVQFDKDLRTDVTLVIEPDQPLEEREEMEFDDEGNLIDKPKRKKPEPKAEEADGEAKGAASAEPAAAGSGS